MPLDAETLDVLPEHVADFAEHLGGVLPEIWCRTSHLELSPLTIAGRPM